MRIELSYGLAIAKTAWTRAVRVESPAKIGVDALAKSALPEANTDSSIATLGAELPDSLRKIN